MLDRWARFCRRLAPPALRESAFDPAVADLMGEAVEPSRRDGVRGPHAVQSLIAWRILGAAIECRWLHLASRPASSAQTWRNAIAAFGGDLRDALRRLRRTPGAAAVVVLILALGIGVNVAVFSFVNAYLLASLPVEHPDRVVRVYARTSAREFDTIPYPDYRDLRNALTTLEVAAHAEGGVQLGRAETRRPVTAELVSGNFFDVMRLRPRHGRLITPEDDEIEGAQAVVVLAEDLWRSAFQSRSDVVGSTVLINGFPFQVIGIAPARFRGASTAYAVSDLWVPIAMHRYVRPRNATREDRNWGWLSMIGRLRPDETRGSVQTELDRTAAALFANVPIDQRVSYVAYDAAALPEADRRQAAQVLGLAGMLTGLVLVAACANVAGLMQVRLAARRRELAIRHALGAGRGRLSRLWIFESLVIALIGGAAGLGAGRLVARLINRWRPPPELLGDISLETITDWRVVAFTTAVTVICALSVGLLPALRAGRVGAWTWLTADAVTTTTGRHGVRLRRVALSVQIAVSVVLLLAGGLLVRSALALNRIDLGFDPANLALAGIDLRTQRVPAADGRRSIAGTLERLRAVPGVTTAAVANTVPLGVGKERWQIRVPGYIAPNGARGVSVAFNRVSREYFDAIGIRFRHGATWDGSFEAPPGFVAVINETMARRFWAGRNPVGSTFEVVSRGTLAVVGVVSDSTYYELGEAPIPYMYLPSETFFPETMVLIARTAVPVAGVLPSIDRELASVDSRLASTRLGAFEELRSVPLYPSRAFATMAIAFGTLVLLLTAVGLYSVVAQVIAQRTREIGVRMALGARTGQIVSSVLRDALWLTAIGGAVGVVTGYAASGALRGWLYGVDPVDVPTYLIVVGLVGVVALIAGLVPARRAARIDPVTALKGI